VIFQNTKEERNGEPLQVTVGDQILDQVVPGVMLAIRTMQQGEVARVDCSHRFAYADRGFKPLVGPNQDIEYLVELVQIGELEKEAVSMTPAELIAHVRTRKERGNYFFKLGNLNKALQCYQDGIKKSESHLPPQPEEGEEHADVFDEYNGNPELIELKTQCLGNIAACFEKQDKLKEAKDACVAVLVSDPNNLKSLLRAARVAGRQGEFVEAKACLKTASQVDGDNPAVKKEIKNLQKIMDDHKNKEKQAYGGFLSPVSPTTEKKASPKSKQTMEAENSPEPVAPEETTQSQSHAETPPRKKQSSASLVTRLSHLVVLLGPLLVAFVIMLLLPSGVKSNETSWNNLAKDKSQKHMDSLGYQTLVCEGRDQRASCCICRQAMVQVELRQERVKENNPGRKEELGFRMDSDKQKVPYERTEGLLMHILDSVCTKLPVDIPFQEKNIKPVKLALRRSCQTMIDEFYDNILLDLHSNAYTEPDAIGHAICEQVIGVCEPRVPWQTILTSLGPGYSDTPCTLCKSVAKAIHEGPRIDNLEPLRSPSGICAKVKLGVPKSETRVGKVSKAIGDACLDLVFSNRKRILGLISEPDTCTANLVAGLCKSECGPLTTKEL